MQTLNISN